jgi:hypothetical protein
MNHGTCPLENMMNHGCGPLTERTPNIEYPAIGTSSRSPTSGQWRSQRQKDERKRIQQIRLEDRLSPMWYLCLKITLVKRKKNSFITCLFYRQSGFYGGENDGRRFLLAQELLYLPVVQQATRIDVAVWTRRRNLLQKYFPPFFFRNEMLITFEIFYFRLLWQTVWT